MTSVAGMQMPSEAGDAYGSQVCQTYKAATGDGQDGSC